MIVTVFTVVLYFGGVLSQSYWLLAASIIVALGFSVLSFRHFEKALSCAGVVAFAQIASTALTTPSYINNLKEFPVERSSLPPIIHLVLDEHAGMAAIPARAVSRKKVRQFQEEYVKRGFIVFTHAYTADKWTQVSLNRLLNANSLWALKLRNKYNSNDFSVPGSSVFKNIAKERVIDATYPQYVDLSKALHENRANARQLTYNSNIMRNDIATAIPLPDRLNIARDRVGYWARKRVKSPVVKWFFEETRVGRNFVRNRSLKSVWPIVGRLVLTEITERLSRAGQRGTYYYAHLLLPHFPYVFDKSCNLFPYRRWVSWAIHPEVSMGRLYRLHFGQASCAAQEVFKLVDAVESHKKIADAVILVHSDHGARIGGSERSWRGSFLAVKIPGMEGRVINTPVRLDTFYRNFLENRFQKIDLEKLKPLKDSPY